jgi:hypothetical protein
MNQATMSKNPNSEQAVLLHLELCYSVALLLTRDVNRALALTKDTLLWAFQRKDGALDSDAMKRALMSELRDRYVRDCQLAGGRAAFGEQRLPKAGV